MRANICHFVHSFVLADWILLDKLLNACGTSCTYLVKLMSNRIRSEREKRSKRDEPKELCQQWCVSSFWYLLTFVSRLIALNRVLQLQVAHKHILSIAVQYHHTLATIHNPSIELSSGANPPPEDTPAIQQRTLAGSSSDKPAHKHTLAAVPESRAASPLPSPRESRPTAADSRLHAKKESKSIGSLNARTFLHIVREFKHLHNTLVKRRQDERTTSIRVSICCFHDE